MVYLLQHQNLTMQRGEMYITLKELAREFGLDRSNVRKYVLSAGFEPVKIRTPESRGQLTLALTMEDAEAVRELRNKEGFLKVRAVNGSDGGYFYVAQLLPEVKPKRVKLGHTNNVKARLSSHQTVAPNVVLLGEWACKRTWEAAVIASITRVGSGCVKVGQEVFDCDNLTDLVDRAQKFFEIMPKQE